MHDHEDGTWVDVWRVLDDPQFNGFRARAQKVRESMRFFVECPSGEVVERAVVDGTVVAIYRAGASTDRATMREVNRAAELLVGHRVRDGAPTKKTHELLQKVSEADAEWRKQTGRIEAAPSKWLASYLDVSLTTAQRRRRLARQNDRALAT